MGFNANLKLILSRQLLLCGAIGGVTGRDKMKGYVSKETQIGAHSTNEWAAGALDRNSSIAFYMESAEDETEKPRDPYAGPQAAFFQFQTLYNHPSGKKRLRVTTIARK